MRVLASTTAGTGHFEPMIPLLRGCADAGHDILVACPESFAEHVTRAGFACAPFDDAPPDQMGAVFGRLEGASYEEGNRVVVGEVFATLDANAAVPRLSDTFAGWHPDVVVRDPSEYGSWLVAERSGVAQTRVAISLLAVESEFAEIAARALAPAAQALGIDGDLDGARLLRSPVLAMAPALFDPPDGLDGVTVQRYAPPAPPRLEQPLPLPEGDAPLVYVTFGTVAASLGLWPGLFRTVIDALADLPVRVLVTTGAGVDRAQLGPLPPRTVVAEFVPQAHLLPQVGVMVTHGGFGTVMGGLRAGIPMVVTPMFADQADNAARVAAAGAGLRVQPSELPMGLPPELGAQTATAVSRLLEDPAATEAAQQLAEAMARHPSVDAAVAVVESAAV